MTRPRCEAVGYDERVLPEKFDVRRRPSFGVGKVYACSNAAAAADRVDGKEVSERRVVGTCGVSLVASRPACLWTAGRDSATLPLGRPGTTIGPSSINRRGFGGGRFSNGEEVREVVGKWLREMVRENWSPGFVDTDNDRVEDSCFGKRVVNFILATHAHSYFQQPSWPYLPDDVVLERLGNDGRSQIASVRGGVVDGGGGGCFYFRPLTRRDTARDRRNAWKRVLNKANKPLFRGVGSSR